MFRIKRYMQAYILAGPNTPAQTEIPFPNQALLQDVAGKEPVYVRSIDVYSSASISGSKLVPGKAIASPADILNTSITLMVGATAELKDIPLSRLNQFIPDQSNYAASTQFPFLLADNKTIDWTQSFVNVVAIAPTTTEFAYIFGISYLYESDLMAMRNKNLDWPDV